jgi:phosphate starvation-inducible PhoH-like protein
MSERITFELEPADTLRLANLCGQFDEHLKQIESRLGVDIFCRDALYTVQGESRTARAARRLLQSLYRLTESEVLTPKLINLHLQESGVAELGDQPESGDSSSEVAV